MSVNVVHLVGNLGKDAELRYTPSGAPVCNFSLATSETWKDKQGVKQERTEWHRCVLWGKTAESLNEYLRKGKTVYIQGSIRSGEYVDKDNVKRRTFDINVDRITLLGGGRRDAADDQPSRHDEAGSQASDVPLDESDIPF